MSVGRVSDRSSVSWMSDWGSISWMGNRGSVRGTSSHVRVIRGERSMSNGCESGIAHSNIGLADGGIGRIDGL